MDHTMTSQRLFSALLVLGITSACSADLEDANRCLRASKDICSYMQVALHKDCVSSLTKTCADNSDNPSNKAIDRCIDALDKSSSAAEAGATIDIPTPPAECYEFVTVIANADYFENVDPIARVFGPFGPGMSTPDSSENSGFSNGSTSGFSSGSSSSSSSGPSNGSTSGSLDCDSYSDRGLTDGQVKPFCQEAWTLSCNGDNTGAARNCDILDGFQSITDDGSNPRDKCPACDDL